MQNLSAIWSATKLVLLATNEVQVTLGTVSFTVKELSSLDKCKKHFLSWDINCSNKKN